MADYIDENGELIEGIYDNVPFKDYLAIEAVSNSYLGRLDKCPANAKIEQEDTDSLILGRATHAFILEGNEAFKKDFAIAPKVDRRTKAGNAKWADFVTANAGKEIISFDDSEKLMGMRMSVYDHPFAAKILSGGVKEQTIIWRDAETGVICKCRPDGVLDDSKKVLADLKTTNNADEIAFGRAVIKYGYAKQAGMYLDGYNYVKKADFDSFIFIAVEPKPPYRVEVYLIADDFVKYGRYEFRRLLEIDQRCKKQGRYPATLNEGITELYKPEWL